MEETKTVSDHIYTFSHYDIKTTEDKVNDICRICLKNNAIMNWDDEIVEFCGISFKDFYYKFTQLEMLDEDPYPKMLCQTCLTELKSAHLLMVKTIESYAVLRGTHLDESKPSCNENNTDDKFKSKCIPKGLNTLIKQNEELVNAIEKLHKTLKKAGTGYKSPKAIDYNTGVINTNSSSFPEINSKSNKRKVLIKDDNYNQDINTISESEIYKIEINDTELHEENNLFHKEYEKVIDFEDSLSNEDNTNDFNDYTEEALEIVNEMVSDHEEYINSSTKETFQKLIIDKTNSGGKEKFVCAYCPKLLSDKKSLERHEETHDTCRERKETCPHCGVKLYTLTDLRMHMRTHSSQREKKHKCEFCDKAYYDRGGLNVHRRIHLGQMLPCTICSKEYYRQQDLDLHKVKAHGVTPIHGNVKLRTKYYVHCNDCNKTMRTTSWKEHQANHLKIPLLKCSLCDIDFCSRCALKWHMAKVHDYKKREEYEPHIVYLKDKRLSHKLLQQQELLLQPNTTENP